jgi:predicted TIM-barrel fold metal-dependent hydrolase
MATPSSSPGLDVVPHSAGTATPRLAAPAGACDAHIHIFDGRFPTAVPASPPLQNATVVDYRALQRRIGTTRAVVVQPKIYGTDNSCTLEAVAQLGANGRGIAVVHPGVDDDQLHRLHAGGIRGLRFSVWNPADTVTTIDMIEPLAPRVAELGWHVQLHISGDQVVTHADMLDRVAAPIVFDHIGRLPPALGTGHAAFAVIRNLLDKGRAWMKLSGAYLNSLVGPPAYAEATAVAAAFARIAPERMVWGSDWPHITEMHKPDDAVLLDLLADWAPDAGVRRRILVDNPAELYGFSSK